MAGLSQLRAMFASMGRLRGVARGGVKAARGRVSSSYITQGLQKNIAGNASRTATRVRRIGEENFGKAVAGTQNVSSRISNLGMRITKRGSMMDQNIFDRGAKARVGQGLQKVGGFISRNPKTAAGIAGVGIAGVGTAGAYGLRRRKKKQGM